MIILDTQNKSIQVSLGVAASKNQCQWVSSYVDLNSTSFKPIESDGVTKDLTPITIIPSPAAGIQRQVKFISIYNADNVTAYVSVSYVDSTNTRTLVSISVPVGNTLVYSNEGLWQLFPTGTFSIPLTVTQGGTGATSFSPYSMIMGGITSTSPLQSLPYGNSYQILTSQGNGFPPVWTTPTSGVTAGTYGGSGHYLIITVNSQGQITFISQT